MTDLLAEVSGLLRAGLVPGGLVFLRIAAVMALLPAFGERIVPARVRLAGALSFTAIVAPAVADHLGTLPATPAAIGGFLLAETLNGLALGFVLRLAILAVEMAGTIAAQSGSLSQMFGTAGEPLPAISHLLVLAAICLAVQAGLHVRAAEALILSYQAIPAGTLPEGDLVRQWSVAHVGRAFALAFSLAAPFVAAALLYNVALGVINRAMPALMVTFVGAPAMAWGVLALLALASPGLLNAWKAVFNDIVANPFAVPR
jgi:flagellar biosynthetic protein FliR